MSHSFDTSTYAIDVAQVPARLESPDQLRAARTAAFLAQEASSDKLVHMHGATRSGWAIYVVKALIESVGLPSLGFLSDEGQHRFETEHGSTDVTILAHESLSSVEADLKRLLELVRENPILAMDADADGDMMSMEEVAQATARDYVTSNPTYDYGNVQGDDGQGADYFFTWVRSILRIVEVARAEGRAVVHELKV